MSEPVGYCTYEGVPALRRAIADDGRPMPELRKALWKKERRRVLQVGADSRRPGASPHRWLRSHRWGGGRRGLEGTRSSAERECNLAVRIRLHHSRRLAG